MQSVDLGPFPICGGRNIDKARRGRGPVWLRATLVGGLLEFVPGPDRAKFALLSGASCSGGMKLLTAPVDFQDLCTRPATEPPKAFGCRQYSFVNPVVDCSIGNPKIVGHLGAVPPCVLVYVFCSPDMHHASDSMLRETYTKDTSVPLV